MIALLLIVFFLIPLLWLTGFLWVTDFSVPTLDVSRFHHVLVIFPHADDEAVSCGGFLRCLSARGCLVTLVILTKGERGTPNAMFDANLKEIRTREAQTVAAILGISRLLQNDWGDEALQASKPELSKFIETLIEQENPDLLITYDLAGFYWHPDHITCSEIITELRKTRFRQVPLWYVTFPSSVLARVKPPEQLTTNLQAQAKQAFPTHKIFIGTSVLPKIKAWYTYKSQRTSLTKGIRRFFPIWFFLSMVLFEYFAEVS